MKINIKKFTPFLLIVIVSFTMAYIMGVEDKFWTSVIISLIYSAFYSIIIFQINRKSKQNDR